MISTWQDAVAILLVAGAGVYLLHRMWKVVSRSGSGGGCGSCGSCPSAKAEHPPLVQLDPPQSDRPAESNGRLPVAGGR